MRPRLRCPPLCDASATVLGSTSSQRNHTGGHVLAGAPRFGWSAARRRAYNERFIMPWEVYSGGRQIETWIADDLLDQVEKRLAEARVAASTAKLSKTKGDKNRKGDRR